MLLPLVLLFIVVPIAELAVIIQVGQEIGVGWTIAILIADSILGSMLMRAQGRAAWRRFNEAMQAGRVPAREVLDGALVMFGGALLLTPGFITDILGFLLLIPPTRAVVRARARAAAHAPDGGLDDRAARAARRRRRGHRGRRRERPPDPARGRALTDAGSERARHPTGPGFSDAVTFSFGDPAAGLTGSRGSASRRSGGSALAVVFDGREPVTALARGGLPVDREADFERLELDGLARPSRSRCGAGRCASATTSSTFEAAGPPAGSSRPSRVARAGGMAGYEQLCRVHGTRPRAARSAASASAATRGASRTGTASSSTRTLAAWLDDGSGVVLSAVRPAGAARPRAARRPGRPSLGAAGALRVDEPRLSHDLRRGGPPAPRRPRAVGRRGRRLSRAAPPARSCAARRSTSGSCGSTARSCAGAWTAAPAVGRYDVLRRA